MGLFNKNKIVMYHVDGLPYRVDCPLHVSFDDAFQNIVFTEFEVGKKKDRGIMLPVSKISRAGNIKIEEIEQGNMLGRAAVGGILFGGAGAIVGAMSAQEKKKVEYLYCINYSTNGEEKSVVLKSGGDISEMKFRRKLRDLLPADDASDEPVVL